MEAGYQVTHRSRERVLLLFELCVLVTSAWLLYSGFAKLNAILTFRRALLEHAIVPREWVPFVERSFPIAELVAGLLSMGLLIVFRRRAAASAVAGVFFFCISGYVWVAHFSAASGKAGCGCGGSSRVIASWLPLAIQDSAIACSLLALSVVFTRWKLSTAGGATKP